MRDAANIGKTPKKLTSSSRKKYAPSSSSSSSSSASSSQIPAPCSIPKRRQKYSDDLPQEDIHAIVKRLQALQRCEPHGSPSGSGSSTNQSGSTTTSSTQSSGSKRVEFATNQNNRSGHDHPKRSQSRSRNQDLPGILSNGQNQPKPKRRSSRSTDQSDSRRVDPCEPHKQEDASSQPQRDVSYQKPQIVKLPETLHQKYITANQKSQTANQFHYSEPSIAPIDPTIILPASQNNANKHKKEHHKRRHKQVSVDEAQNNVEDSLSASKIHELPVGQISNSASGPRLPARRSYTYKTTIACDLSPRDLAKLKDARILNFTVELPVDRFGNEVEAPDTAILHLDLRLPTNPSPASISEPVAPRVVAQTVAVSKNCASLNSMSPVPRPHQAGVVTSGTQQLTMINGKYVPVGKDADAAGNNADTDAKRLSQVKFKSAPKPVTPKPVTPKAVITTTKQDGGDGGLITCGDKIMKVVDGKYITVDPKSATTTPDVKPVIHYVSNQDHLANTAHHNLEYSKSSSQATETPKNGESPVLRSRPKKKSCSCFG